MIKRLVISVVAAGLIYTNALAGSLSFQVTDATDGTVTRTFSQFSDADITRWIAAWQAPCNATLVAPATCTRLQVLAFIVNNFVASQIQIVRSFERQNASDAAAAAISSITINP